MKNDTEHPTTSNLKKAGPFSVFFVPPVVILNFQFDPPHRCLKMSQNATLEKMSSRQTFPHHPIPPAFLRRDIAKPILPLHPDNWHLRAVPIATNSELQKRTQFPAQRLGFNDYAPGAPSNIGSIATSSGPDSVQIEYFVDSLYSDTPAYSPFTLNT